MPNAIDGRLIFILLGALLVTPAESICSFKTGNDCSTCAPGTYLGFNQTCHACFTNCKVCRGPKEADCAIPADGFYFDDVTSQVTACKMENCARCNGRRCLECQHNFRPLLKKDRIKKCKKCEENCQFCDHMGCIRCQNGYLLRNDTCVMSNGGCGETPNPDRPYYQFYSWETDRCFRCPYGCLECTRDDRCVHCQPGYRLNHKSHTCERCADIYCLHCPEDRSKCVDCGISFFTDLTYGRCLPCAPNCSACFGRGKDQCKFCFFPHKIEKQVSREELERFHANKEEFKKKYQKMSGYELKHFNYRHFGQKNFCVLECQKTLKSGKCGEILLDAFEDSGEL